MPNPATTPALQDERIPGLPDLPVGADRTTLTVPVFYPATNKTHQAPLVAGDGATTSNAVVGGPKLVQYRDSRLFGVPGTALTLDRLKPLTIVPGTLATVDNPADAPLSSQLPPANYVAAVVAAGTAGAVLVPRYIGAAEGDTVPIIWQKATSSGTPTDAYTKAEADALLAKKTPLPIAYTLAQAQQDLRDSVDLTVGARYDITGNWNATSAPAIVFVQALRRDAFSPSGVLLTGGVYSVVKVDVPAGTAVATQPDLSAYARLASPIFTGTPTAPTPGIVDKSEKLATTRFVQDLLSLSFTKAYPLVCVRASGELNFTLTTLESATAWTNGGGPGSITYVNRPQVVNNFVILGPGTILDLQQNQVDLNSWVIRLGNHSEIRNNRLIYSGRIAPDYGDGTPFSVTVKGGTLAGRINFLINNGATVVLDGVAVADFGQQLLGGLNAGPATSAETGVTVILRNGSYFSAGYLPHPNTVVTTEAPTPGGGGSYSDAEAAAAAVASLVAGNSQHQGVQVSDVGGVPKLTVAGAVIDIVRLRMPAAGSGNLAEGQDLRDADAGGSYWLTATANVARFAIINPAGPNTLFDGKATDFPAAGVPLQGSTWFTYQIVSVDVTQPVFLELSLIH